jgi:hypothetical protein
MTTHDTRTYAQMFAHTQTQGLSHIGSTEPRKGAGGDLSAGGTGKGTNASPGSRPLSGRSDKSAGGMTGSCRCVMY